MFVELAIIAYFIDAVFGEFAYIKHPVIFMGDYINYFEQHYYQNSVTQGGLLTLSLLLIVFAISYAITLVISSTFLLGIIASTGIASKMLYDAVQKVIDQPQTIQYLVSRDTDKLNASDINKAAIESYAENLSDGVIAPLFYLLLLGLPGLFVYKAINTLDSMVGYKNKRYLNFGKIPAKLDDLANWLPARLTALLIALLMHSKTALKHAQQYGHLHTSPNAGYPISAMAGVCNISLGGATPYFGKLQAKATFGCGSTTISHQHIFKALSFKIRFDIFVLLFGLLWLTLFT